MTDLELKVVEDEDLKYLKDFDMDEVTSSILRKIADKMDTDKVLYLKLEAQDYYGSNYINESAYRYETDQEAVLRIARNAEKQVKRQQEIKDNDLRELVRLKALYEQ